MNVIIPNFQVMRPHTGFALRKPHRRETLKLIQAMAIPITDDCFR